MIDINVDDNKYPELLRDLIDKGAEAIAEALKIDMPQARKAAVCIAEILRRDWAGQQPYLPKGLSFETSRRDREMYAKFNGSNHAELAKEYGLSTRQVYERLAVIREEEFLKRQPSFF